MESKIYLGHYQTKVWTPNQNLSNKNGVQDLSWALPN